MDRTANLISHLPAFLQEYRELQMITGAENPEFQALFDASERIKNNLFVISADETGVARFEKMLGLIQQKEDNLQNRKANILARYTNSVAYTLRGFIERLNIICGVGNYTIDFSPKEYTINVVLDIRAAKLINAIATMADEMIPANILCSCTVVYNTHEVLSKYPSYLLMQFTERELREEPIEDLISASCGTLSKYKMDDLKSISCEQLAEYGMRKV